MVFLSVVLTQCASSPQLPSSASPSLRNFPSSPDELTALYYTPGTFQRFYQNSSRFLRTAGEEHQDSRLSMRASSFHQTGPRTKLTDKGQPPSLRRVQKRSPLWNIPTNRDTIHSINNRSSFLQVNDYHYAEPLYHLAHPHYDLEGVCHVNCEWVPRMVARAAHGRTQVDG